MNETNVNEWTCEEVKQWLCDCRFDKYIQLFCDEHGVDGEALLVLTENDLRQPPLQIPVLGDIKRLGIALRRLQHSNNNISKSYDAFQARYNDDTQRSPTTPSDYESNTDDDYKSNGDSDRDVAFRRRLTNIIKANHIEELNKSNGKFSNNDTRNGLTGDNIDTSCVQSRHIPAEPWKTFLSFVYVFTVFWITAFVMVIVHDRVPDMEKYPPLPDLFLDNMPYVPWAFECCEIIAIVLGSIWISILCFHKHRFILLRRLFSLTGTVFLLRSVTMLITSMSVPGMHLNCSGKTGGDIWSKLERTIVIWRGFGMSLQGVRSCGDYMFSGHTVIITMTNFFITEYTPQAHMYYLHTTSWVLNLFGIFFILAAHEHYSIDVFIAFYITSRLFLYYHTLANNQGYMVADVKRTKVWFPLFSFFESKCNGPVPNEYEWPLPYPKSLKQYFKNLNK